MCAFFFLLIFVDSDNKNSVKWYYSGTPQIEKIIGHPHINDKMTDHKYSLFLCTVSNSNQKYFQRYRDKIYPIQFIGNGDVYVLSK